ncbi:hypothetical protein J1N35_044474 [Gossypium stocksii]|uniref:Transposase MuDR plant domain-containing protein n=1 Tax=Gossypium stocksii TaxID=47602 RepID=A0A9D3ZG04_9ROSI|nr:hypothetical protein J1N35_044474 [Gossypium stocksii]
MLDFWIKFKEIDLYVEHEVDNPITVDENFLLTTGEGDVEEVEVDGGDDEVVESDDEYIGVESGGHISLGSTVGEDNDKQVTADEYAGDFATSDGVDNVVDKYIDGLDNVVAASSGEEEDRNDTKFKSVIRKYSKECRRQLKFIKNEPKRAVVKCIAYLNCPWRIRASYSPIVKCLQIKTFQDEHHCSVSFKNKMVTVAMIAQHFEATIKDYPKMEHRKIQRKCASEMHVNVTIDCRYRAKKIVKEKMAGIIRRNLAYYRTMLMS